MKRFLYRTALTVLILSFVYDWYFTYDYIQVQIDKGILRGYNSTSWKGAEFFIFKGIPYAKPPVGDFRFKGPEEESPWVGVRDAISHGSVCPQVDMLAGFVYGDEDCLFLNVYTPSIEKNGLPVMVFVPGGAFVYGSGNDDIYGPDYFMESEVVLVTMNYRLGALGFLSTGNDGAPGNSGLKDQVAALRWVKRNIAKFGGDPEDVTIFGESAGSVSIHFHILSPMSKGLFSKAISQSGSALIMWAIAEDAVSAVRRLAQNLGAKDEEDHLEFLKSVPYEDIVRVQSTLATPEEERKRMSYLFLPTVEKGVGSEEVFLPDFPQKILESGNYNKVPYVTGYTSHEGYFLYREMVKPETMKTAFEDTERFVPYDIRNENLRRELGGSIREFYFKDKPIGNENISNLIDLNTDTTFVIGINRATKLHLETTDSPIYFYVFSYDGGLNFLKYFFRIDLPGAAHADDLGYLFYPRKLFWRKPASGSEDEEVIDTMIRLWTNFAKYGNPTPPGDPLTWKPATIDEFYFLNISGRDTKLSVNPDEERSKFWEKAYEKNSALQD